MSSTPRWRTTRRDAPARRRPQIPDSQKDVGSNHAVSALKFRILQNFIKLGYAVLLSGERLAAVLRCLSS